MVPPLVTGRASMNGTPLMVMVVPEGMVSVPLPPMVPPDQFIAAPVRLTFPVPLNVPPLMVRVGIDCALGLLMLSVPLDMRTAVDSVPLMLFVPLLHCSVPAPEMLDAASKVRVSLLANVNVAPEETLNVAPVLVVA